MNKIILSLLLTIAFAVSANAQNCVNSSRCDELGYTKTTTDCNGLDILKCPFDSNKVFCSSAGAQGTCRIGDILYSDMSCSPAVISGKTPIGIVFYDRLRLAMALDEKNLEWGGYGKEIGSAARGTLGKDNTAAILAYGKANNISYPAAEYCNSYSTVGTKVGDWFLPSMEELKLLSGNFSAVNASLQALGKPTIAERKYYLSSSELNNTNAWIVFMNSSNAFNSNKNLTYYVRPVLTF